MSFTRREFLLRSGAAVAATALAPTLLSACGAAGDAAAFRYWQQKDKAGLGDLEYIAQCGTLAPSAHNTQPWKFRLLGDRIEVYADTARHLGSADAERRMMQISIGCAIENMRVAARRLGYQAQLQGLDADARFAQDGYCATLGLQRVDDGSSHPWFDAIFERQTTRTAFEPLLAPPADFIAALAQGEDGLPGIGLKWFAADVERARMSRLATSTVRLYLDGDARHRDGMRWFRSTRREWSARGDGIALFNSDAPLLVKQYVEWFATPEQLLSENFQQGEIDATDKVAPATPLWGLVYADQTSPNSRLRAGQMAERVYLEAAARGYAVQPLCYPTETPEGQFRLRTLAALSSEAEPLFVFRVGRSDFRAKSTRRELRDVLLA